MSTITDPTAIHALQLRAQRSAIKLEALGMRRRGQSITAAVKQARGLKKSTTRGELIAILTSEIDQLDTELLRRAKEGTSQ